MIIVVPTPDTVPGWAGTLEKFNLHVFRRITNFAKEWGLSLSLTGSSFWLKDDEPTKGGWSDRLVIELLSANDLPQCIVHLASDYSHECEQRWFSQDHDCAEDCVTYAKLVRAKSIVLEEFGHVKWESSSADQWVAAKAPLIHPDDFNIDTYK